MRGLLALCLAVSTAWACADPVLVPAPRTFRPQPGAYACGSNGLSSVEVRYRRDVSLKPEGYRLSITTGDVEVVHADAAGAFYARQTLKQLCEGEGPTRTLPCCEVEDWPEYGWRGVHFDDSRHFFGRETLKGVLDLMAQHKLNVLHWHLTDDQGWRLEIPGYPELAHYAACRPESPVHGELLKGSIIGKRTIPTNGQAYGPYIYSEEDIRDIVAYAAERQITIVPEIELPGHFAAVLAAYPEFACVPENFARRSPRCIWGIDKDVLCVGNDRALKFMDDVLSYVCRVFPGKYVHIGGDECPVDRWRECPKCQKRRVAEGLKDEHALQPWVTRRAERLLKSHGKRIVGWDEYLVGDIPEDAVGMIWHTRKPRNDHDFLPADQAVRRGHDVVMTPHDKTYFYYRQGIPDDPFIYGGGLVTLECAYGFDPAAYVPAECRSHLLGGQCCNWSEYTWNEYDLAWKLWPRGCAIAETLWTGSAKPGYDDFLRRMRQHRRRLLRQGVNCAPLPPFADYGGTPAVEPFPTCHPARAVTSGPHDHLLASYFAIDAWSPDKRYLLVLETDLVGRLPGAGERCTLGVVDLEDGNRFIPVTTTACWNFQEAAMGHWLNDDEIVFNDIRNGRFCAVVMDWRRKSERILPMPISALSPDRTWAVSINYARLSLTRPDYGYAGPGQDARESVEWPQDDGLWTMDMKTGETKLVLPVSAGRAQMPQTKVVAGKPGHPLAYYCHTAISRGGSRIFFLARSVDWFNAETHEISAWRTTSFTVNRDGSGLRRCFADDTAGGSHFNWLDDKTLAITVWPKGANGRYSAHHMKVTVGEEEKGRMMAPGLLDWDGHCVFSPDGKWMSTEGYYDHNYYRHWAIMRVSDESVRSIGSYYVPEKYRGEYWRCDLHARYRSDGRQLSFNSVHEGSRQVYIIDIEP